MGRNSFGGNCLQGCLTLEDIEWIASLMPDVSLACPAPHPTSPLPLLLGSPPCLCLGGVNSGNQAGSGLPAVQDRSVSQQRERARPLAFKFTLWWRQRKCYQRPYESMFRKMISASSHLTLFSASFFMLLSLFIVRPSPPSPKVLWFFYPHSGKRLHI